MPELPDLTIYIERLSALLAGQTLENIRIRSPFLLRTVEIPPGQVRGLKIERFSRIGKMILWHLEGDYVIAIHLMIAGRYHWKQPGANARGRNILAAFDVAIGTLLLTEASTRKRAAMYIVRGNEAPGGLDRGGLEVMGSSPAAFRAALLRENHTLKRTLTDPRLFSAIGNAYSDEILHRARLSPLQLTRNLSEEEIAGLHACTIECLNEWVERLRSETGDSFPEKVTAFRKEMAVHGKFGHACPVCATKVQHIVYAENECDYCPRCQTRGKILADRSLSRLLKDDWPATIEELESSAVPGLRKSGN